MTEVSHADRGHSPLGASSAERWMNCAGSVALIGAVREQITALGIPEEDDPDYRREGTALHEAAEHCLREGCDTWEIAGQVFNETVIDAPMADAIQLYLDVCRREIDTAALYYVEFPVSSPIHALFYGSLDFAAIHGKPATKAQQKALGWKEPFIIPELVVVTDLKGGEGIVVEPYQNPQLKYYAFGIIDKNPHWPDETPVLIRIVQPRAFHTEGAVREWRTTVGEIRTWVNLTLLPAMLRAEMDSDLNAGDWCRFCPAKLICPALTSLFKAASTADPKEIVNYSDETIGLSWQHIKGVKFYIKALEEEVFRRLNAGHSFPEVAKLVPKKSNRVFKAGAPALAQDKFGDDAFTKPEIKSPAELERLSPAAKEFVKEWAYSPDTGLTVAAWDDSRPAVRVQSTTEAFGAAVAALGSLEDTK